MLAHFCGVWSAALLREGLPILSFGTDDEVIARANRTEFGLASEVFTKEIQRGHRVIQTLDACVTWMNIIWRPCSCHGGLHRVWDGVRERECECGGVDSMEICIC